MLSQSDYPLPPEFEKAYSRSEKLVFETDIQESKTQEFQEEALKKMVYTDGRNLKMVLSEAMYLELEQHLSNRSIPIANLINFKAGAVAITLVVIEMQRLGIVAKGVDEFYSSKALKDQKELGELETIDEQLELISRMGEGQEDALIADALRDINEMPEKWLSIKDAWRHGDYNELAEVVVAPMKKDFPELYNELVVKRNNAWVPKIETMLKTKDVEFVLVGALHLVGDDGVLAQLAARGYGIQKPWSE